MAHRVPQDSKIVKHWNLLWWEECVQCKMEYRRQSGWKLWEWNRSYHLCTSCAPTLKDAQEIFNKKPWIPERPKAPVGPPKSR